MKMNEIAGTGNHYSYPERGFDPRIVHWWSRDPHASSYPSVSPYVFALDNPIMFNDPDGRDVAVAIGRNLQGGGGTIQLSSTVFVSGSNAAAVVAASNKAFGEWKNNGGTYTDKAGNKWDVKVQMTFKVATAEDIARIQNAKAEEAGENLMNSDNSGRAHAGGGGAHYTGGGKFHATGNMAYVGANEGGRVAVHENMHLNGLGDRYTDVTYDMAVNGKSIGRTNASSKTHVGFEGDIMSDGWGMSQEHINDLGAKALEVSTEKGSDNFIMGREADHSRSAPNTVDKVPQTFKSGNTEYSDPKYQPVR